MNSELQSQNLVSIIIPTVYREDYLGALRALSRRDRPEPLIRMLVRAQNFSNLEFAPYKTALKTLEARNWFEDASDAKVIERA